MWFFLGHSASLLSSGIPNVLENAIDSLLSHHIQAMGVKEKGNYRLTGFIAVLSAEVTHRYLNAL